MFVEVLGLLCDPCPYKSECVVSSVLQSFVRELDRIVDTYCVNPDNFKPDDMQKCYLCRKWKCVKCRGDNE